MVEKIEKTPRFSDASVNVKELLASGDYVVVFDTNVYLGLYRFSPDYANFALECLQEIQPHIMLPYTVKVEFMKNSRPLFKRRQGVIEHSVKDTLDLVDTQRTKLKNSSKLVDYHFPDADEFHDKIDKKYDELKTLLTGYFQERSVLSLINDSWKRDVVFDLVQELLNDNQLMVDFTRDEVYAICEDGEKRYKKKIPPGYKDVKDKDGLRKYSDLILWKEVIRFAKEKQKNIIFVTDDVKPDWWDGKNNQYEFLPQLVQEFEKDTKTRATTKGGETGPSMTIVPFISNDFYEAVSETLDVPKSDAVDQALKMTDSDYIDTIEIHVFESIVENLIYSGMDYVNESILTALGSIGVDEWAIEQYMLSSFTMVERDDDQILYELIYNVKMSGTSYEYIGRDEDTKEMLEHPEFHHGVEGQVIVMVVRTVDMLMNFDDSHEYDSAEIVSGDFEETSFSHAFEDEYEDVPYTYTTCPDCGRGIHNENDGGNGFCVECAPNH